MSRRQSLSVLVMLLLSLVACGLPAEGTMRVEQVWTRPTPQGAQNTAFYMTIRNETGQDDVLTGVQSGFCQTVELHRSMVDDEGVMQMESIEGGRLPLPAGETVELAPGGLHAMCLGVSEPLQEGDRVVLTLQFENNPDVQVTAEAGDTTL